MKSATLWRCAAPGCALPQVFGLQALVDGRAGRDTPHVVGEAVPLREVDVRADGGRWMRRNLPSGRWMFCA